MKPKSNMTTIEIKKPSQEGEGKLSHECEGKLLKDAIDFVCKICGYHRREYDDGRVKTINFGDRRAKHYGNLLWR